MTDSDIHKKLYDASSGGDDTLVRELLTAGADPDKYKDSNGFTALIVAVNRGNDSIVSILIQHGANPNIQNKYENTALHNAALNGNNEVITTLIKAGADLNIQNDEGKTALYRAAENGNNEVITTLIEAGADLNIQRKDGNTALQNAAWNGNNEVTTTLIEAGADLNIQNKDGETALCKAIKNRYNEVTTTLIKAGADLNKQDKNGVSALEMAVGNGYDVDAVIKWFEEGAKVSSLASKMMNTDPGTISSVLDFLSKKLDKFKNNQNKDDYHKTKEILGIETKRGKEEIMFFNIKCKNLYDKSLLQYIDSQNVRFTRQREELIDLSIKIANLNHKDDREKAMEEVIKHYKSGLPSGVGLRDMISQIKERYPWSSSKKIIMIFVSLMTCLLGIGLYVLDLTTDVQFSLEMLKKTRIESSNVKNNFDSFPSFPSLHSDYPECFVDYFNNFLSNKSFNFSSLKSDPDHQTCLADMNSVFKKKYNKKLNNAEDYGVTAWISVWHCIQPFVITMVVFITINYKRCCSGGCSGVKFSLLNIPDVPYFPEDFLVCGMFNYFLCCIPSEILWPLGYLLGYFLGYLGYFLFKGLVSALLVVGRLVPIPAFTNLYRFYLDVRCHHARSKPDFRDKIPSNEEEITEHEALG